MKFISVLIYCIVLPSTLFAQEQINELLSRLDHAANDSQKIEAYKQVIVHYSIKNPDSQGWYVNQAINFSAKNKYRMGEAEIFKQLALLDENQGRVVIARQRADYALKLYRELNNLKGVAEMLHNIGAIEAGKGNYDIAIKYFISSLKVYDTVTDYHGQLLAYMNLGNLYLEHQDTTNAWKYLKIADSISKKTPLSDATIFLYNIMGVMYAETGKLEKARQIFLNDLELSDKHEFVNSHVECLLYLGEFYLDKGDIPQALKYLQQGLTTAKENNLQEMEANILMEMATTKEKSNKDEALDYLNQARELCENIQSKSFLSNVYNEIASVYERSGDYKEALIATRKKQNILDSIYNLNKTIEIAGLGATYELEKSNLRINELESKSKEDAEERKVIIFISIVIILILLVLLLLYRKTRILNRKLIIREQELKELNATKDKLFSIIGHDLRGPMANVPVILNMYEDPQTEQEEKKFLMASLRELVQAASETLEKLLYWGKSLVKGNLLKQQKLNPKELINAAIDLKKTVALAKQIAITDTTPSDLSVFAAATHFDFIIRNLLDNALKYSHPGGTIEISADTGSMQGFTVFAIKDEGVGINKQDIAGIFGPLNSKAGTANEKGTGIGLMLCKEFAIQNGGDLWVESEPGKGTTFFFSVKNTNG